MQQDASSTASSRFVPFRSLGCALLIGLLTACGGGGGGSSSTPSPNPPAGGWTPGVFQPSSTFAAQCAAPRSGIDPATNMAYPDVQGTVTSENNWLRSWSNELYLWYDEILDRDPASIPSTSLYFESMKTMEVTPSGNPKDRFHFTYPSDEWLALSQSGATIGYGVEWAILQATPPREAVVLYVEPGQPAAIAPANLARGARLLSIDNVDFVNNNTQVGVDALNAALFPDQPGEPHTFQVQDLSGGDRTFTMTSAIVISSPVHNVDVVPTASGPVGYLVFNDHIATAEQALVNAITTLDAANITDLVLDVRYNGGGYLVIASQLAYMIAGNGPTGAGSLTFEQSRFNDKHPTTNPVTGSPIAPLPFVNRTVGLSSPSGQALPALDLQRVFMITSPNTCSASESIINGLQGVGVDVIQIGSTTCGKPYGFYPEDNCGTTYFSIQFQGVNALGFGDYTDGFSPQNTLEIEGVLVPGCSVGDDYTHALGDPLESRLAAALAYRAGGQLACPAPSGTGGPGPGFSKPGAPLSAADGRMLRPPWRENRILER